MTIRRSFSMFALPLAIALVASTAHADTAKKQTKPADKMPIKVESPTMATSVKDWHPELAAGPDGKPVKRSSATMGTAGQQQSRGKRSTKPSERAQEVPLRPI